MFVTAEDFNTAPFDLPNLEGNTSFDDFVDQHEEDVLSMLLGRSLYTALIEGLAVEPPEEIELRWLALRDGSEYTKFGKPYYWPGIKKMLVPYIYSKWLEYGSEHTTGVGVVVANTENSSVTGPKHKIVRAWNKFIGIAGGETYTIGTLYGFLSTSGNTYTDVYPVGEYSDFRIYLHRNCTYLGYKNIIGI